MKWCLSLSGFGSARQSRHRPAAREGEGLLSRVPVPMSPRAGMRVLGKGLLLVDEASQLQPFFSCMASYLACVTTCTTTVLCSVCGHADLTGPTHLPCMTGQRPPMAAAPPKVHRETPVCCRGRQCGGAPWARRPGLLLFFFPKQTKSHNIYYALRASNHSRFFYLTSLRSNIFLL